MTEEPNRQESGHDGPEGGNEQAWEAPLMELVLKILTGDEEPTDNEENPDVHH